MNQATKGALLSGLVYPGSGQLFLGRMSSGLVCMMVVTVGLGVLIYRIAARIDLITDQILLMQANSNLSLQKLIDLLNHAGYARWDVELISLIVTVVCWAVSIAHAYWLGLNEERRRISETNSQNPKPRD